MLVFHASSTLLDLRFVIAELYGPPRRQHQYHHTISYLDGKGWNDTIDFIAAMPLTPRQLYPRRYILIRASAGRFVDFIVPVYLPVSL
jgi:hypothetical protein